MLHQRFPYPAIDRPLSRLHTYDGLMINAKRWQLAHDYHRRRQAIHYQSINQPGIVFGLGVRKLETPPPGVPAPFRDQRWLEIQPGLAIDGAGNPIIVNERIAFRIEAEAPAAGIKVVHLVLSYVEPKHLHRQHHTDASDEQYRIDEKVISLPDSHPADRHPPDPSTDRHLVVNGHLEPHPINGQDIELCRLWLEADEVNISNPVDVLCPDVNEIDLRYRPQAQARPQAVVRLAWVDRQAADRGDRTYHNLACLMRSVAALYPVLQGIEDVDRLPLQPHDPVPDTDLIYVSEAELQELQPHQLATLQTYVQQGITLLIELDKGDEADTIPTIQRLEANLSVYLEKVVQRQATHACCLSPFLFDALPTIAQQPIQLWVGVGVVVVVGRLSTAWGIYAPTPLPRHEIRAAQELGVNLLQFALRRRQLTQLLQ
ncbi:MAG: hypothetical protein VKK04_17845 [Synechococcales bacterium]|nr:hypothetical protein [Synechococcales bacterium]